MMKRALLLGLTVMAGVSTLLLAKTMEPGPQTVRKDETAGRTADFCLPVLDNRVHRFGKMWFNMTNQGWYGNDDQSRAGALDDPCLPGVWAPQQEYPGGSGQQYLYQGSIWIGALIVDDTGLETARVSFGSEGWEPDVNELYPTCGEDARIIETSTRMNGLNCTTLASIYDSLAVSEQDFKAMYADTLENYPTVVSGQGYDGEDRNHISLGVEVEQESHSWSYSYAQDFIIVDFRITNVGSKFLKNLYVGLYMDADIGHKDESDRHTDDFCGFRPFAVDSVTGQAVQINAAYIADNDGREHDIMTGTNFTCPHVVGTRVLRAPNPMLQTTFNWWNSNSDATQDYGPTWAHWGEHPECLIAGEPMTWTATYGTPLADVNKYQTMANGEFDPDMYAIDPNNPPAGQLNPRGNVCVEPDTLAWLMPGPQESVQLDGDDTRYLLSWGPLGVYDYTDGAGVNVYRLNPGESFIMTVAFVAGENLHNRSNPQTGITGRADGRIDPARFDWTDFDFNAIWAQRVYDNEMYDTPIYDTDFDGVLDLGDGYGGEDVGLDGLWAPAIGDTVRYFGHTVINPLTSTPAIYPGPDADGSESNGVCDSTAVQPLFGGEFNENRFLWDFLSKVGCQEMREDSFLVYAGPKFSTHGHNVDDWYIGHMNANYVLDPGTGGWLPVLDLGDGIPDFQGPPPPPCPDMHIETGDDYVDLIWSRAAMDDSYQDPFSHVQDFEGFRIWVNNTSMDNEFTLLDEFDNVNYAYFDTDNALRTLPDFGPLGSLPMRETNRGWERQQVGRNSGFASIAVPVGELQESILLDINDDYWVTTGTGFNETIGAYNSAVAVRSSGGSHRYFLVDGLEVYNQLGAGADPATGRLFTLPDGSGVPVLGERFQDEANNQGVFNNSWDHQGYDVEFRYRVNQVHSLFPRYYSVTAYDFGDYQTGTEPLETAQSCNSLRQAPSGVPGRQVRVVPNPYRADVDYTRAYSFGNSEQGLQWENQDDGTRDWYPQQDRRIEFMNLPEQSIIRIYTVAGDLVQQLPHNLEGDRSRWDSLYSEHWDLNSRNFQQVASGLYYFSVEDKTPAGDGEISTGKFVIIK
jgi:hypothetical protein